MGSLRRRDHFIKIIAVDTKEIEMLKIPTKFMKMHGNTLTNTLCLKVQNGGVWKVDVVKKDGEVWFQNGWKEFAEHYSLKYGSLLVFRYDGNSSFRVLIFDRSASEIDYPLHIIPDEGNRTIADRVRKRRMFQEPKMDPIETSMDSLDELSLRQKQEGQLQDNGRIADRVQKRRMFQEPKVEPIEISRDSLDDFSLRQRQEGKVEYSQLTPKDIAIMRRPSSSGIANVLAPADRSNPSFKTSIFPSCLQYSIMNVPADFAKEVTQKNAVTVMLKLANKLWPVNLHSYENHKRSRFYGGLAAFLRENTIHEGDECVFELIDKDGGILNVTVSRRRG